MTMIILSNKFQYAYEYNRKVTSNNIFKNSIYCVDSIWKG
jgi:hypothetical protein